MSSRVNMTSTWTCQFSALFHVEASFTSHCKQACHLPSTELSHQEHHSYTFCWECAALRAVLKKFHRHTITHWSVSHGISSTYSRWEHAVGLGPFYHSAKQLNAPCSNMCQWVCICICALTLLPAGVHLCPFSSDRNEKLIWLCLYKTSQHWC